jgi:asparaginyl-tRNA synthetase
MTQQRVVSIGQIAQYEGQNITIKGWLRLRRSSGKLSFLTVRDGTGDIQAIVSKATVGDEQFALCGQVTLESSIIVTGQPRKDARAPGGFELDVASFQVVHLSEPFPIQPKEHGIGFLMEHRHLWLRSSRQHAILRVRHEIIRTCRNACEGTTTLFQTQYFDQVAYLAQSGQLYGEAAAAAFGKIYCFGPTFRAEKSKTRRHLMEFWMVEPEIAFAELPDVMQLAEELVSVVIQRVLEHRRAELDILERDVAALEAMVPPFPQITYEEAIARLKEKDVDIQFGDDFGSEQETILAQSFDRPVLVHRYPAAAKAFYMARDPERPDLALCMDMLAPEGYGEIIGGGQRIHDLETLRQQIAAHELPEEAFKWYVDLRRYGSVPHAGFGMGIERVVAWICGLDHVRETIPFPRMLYTLYP